MSRDNERWEGKRETVVSRETTQQPQPATSCILSLSIRTRMDVRIITCAGRVMSSENEDLRVGRSDVGHEDARSEISVEREAREAAPSDNADHARDEYRERMDRVDRALGTFHGDEDFPGALAPVDGTFVGFVDGTLSGSGSSQGPQEQPGSQREDCYPQHEHERDGGKDETRRMEDDMVPAEILSDLARQQRPSISPLTAAGPPATTPSFLLPTPSSDSYLGM